jgi:hypothetical protein
MSGGFSGTPGQGAMAPDGTPLSPPDPQYPGLTVEEVSQGTAQLERELAVYEPGAPGSTVDNVGPPPSSGDGELDDMRSYADRLLPAINDADGDVDTYEGGDDAGDDDADVAEYGDPDEDGEVDETDDEGEDEDLVEAVDEETDDSSQELLDGLMRADSDILDQLWIPRFKELGMDADQARGLIETYAEAQLARTAQDQGDVVESKAALSQMLGGEAQLGVALEEIRDFLGDSERISPQLADALTLARMPDGRRLINDPGFALLLLGFAKASAEDRVDDAVAYRELTDAMNESIDDFQNREWRGTGKTGSEVMLGLERRYSGRGPRHDDVGAPQSSEWTALEHLLNTDITGSASGRSTSSSRASSRKSIASIWTRRLAKPSRTSPSPTF